MAQITLKYKTMKNNKNITAEQLKAVKYGDLLETFTELGVKDVWRGGKKKTTMIEEALAKLAVLRELEEKGMDEAEQKAELESIEIKKEEIKIQEDIKEAIAKEQAENAEIKKVVETKLTKEQVEKNLKVIAANIAGGPASHRQALFAKQEILEDLLKQF